MYKYEKSLVTKNIIKKHVGKKLIFLNEVDSTNNYAQRLAKEGEIQGSVVVCDHQHAGKGRLDRKWFSPRGLNLYLSFILRPDIKIEDVNVFTFITSIATVNTLYEYGINSDIKWPNDVLINRKKVSGVLTELNISNNKLEYVVVGVGVNLNIHAAGLEGNKLLDTATSVYIEKGETVDRNQFLIKFLNNLDYCYDDYILRGKEYIYKQWTCRWDGKDKIVRVSMDKETFEAKCIGLDDKGYMIVEKHSGEMIKIVSGDVNII
jgi:BirA family biotin operon repressor/biotin-[acetyl-CoA-carboxylase] ligase